MIIGDRSIFAIESVITRAFERQSLRALGYFVIYIGGQCYGRREPDSTMLACSFDEVGDRIAHRGRHTASFSAEPDAGAIADAVRLAVYAPEQQNSLYFGMSEADFADVVHSKHLLWAPDGDQAFDDHSYILQFDVEDQVRLVAFKSDEEYRHNSSTLNDVWLPADKFYPTLQRWHDDFENEWAMAPKEPLP